jgi:hypothetical protein
MLKDHHGAHVGSLLEQCINGLVKSVEFAGTRRLLRFGGWCYQIFGNRPPVQLQMARNVAQRPFLMPVKAVNFIPSSIFYASDPAWKPAGCSFQGVAVAVAVGVSD